MRVTFSSAARKYRRTLYEVAFSNYVDVAQTPVPREYTIADKTQGVFLSQRVHVSITDADQKRFERRAIYPKVSQFRTIFLDRRISENYHLTGHAWPYRASSFFATRWRQHIPSHKRRIYVIAGILLLLFGSGSLFVVPAGTLIEGVVGREPARSRKRATEEHCPPTAGPPSESIEPPVCDNWDFRRPGDRGRAADKRRVICVRYGTRPVACRSWGVWW